MRLGRYELLRKLGKGGSGSAWEALDPAGRRVALKQLDPNMPRELLRNEFARLAGRLHPHLVEVFDFEATPDTTFYTASLVEGASWTPSTWRRDRPIVIGVLRALAFLHDQGLRHGDIKPANVMVRGSHAVVIDLGCAAPGGIASPTVSGTLAFMPPEVRSARVADGRADIHSLGVVLAEMCKALPKNVQSLVDRMRADDPVDRPDAREALELLGAPDISAAAQHAPRLLGREDELSRFDQCLRALEDGEAGPRVLRIEGQTGSGRSRLLRELKWRAQLRGTCFQLTSPRKELDALFDTPAREWPKRTESMPPAVVLVDDVDQLSVVDRKAVVALARALSRQSPWLLVLAGRELPQIEGAETVHLQPLSLSDLRTWLGDRAPTMLRLTGGFPREVHALLAADQDSVHATIDEVRAAQLARLPTTVKRIIGLVAVTGGADIAWQLGSPEALSRAIEAGFVVRRDTRVQLTRPIERDKLTQHASKRDLRSLAKRVPEAERFLCRVFAGDVEAASELADAVQPTDHPNLDRAVADGMVRIGRLSNAGRILEAIGDAKHAAALYEKAARQRPRSGAIQLRLGACLLRLERLDDAEKALERARATKQSKLAALDLLARIQIKRGHYAEAKALAEEGLNAAKEPALRMLLLEDLGVAASYLGEHELAQTSLGMASANEHVPPRARVRALSYLAIDHWRRGQIDRAAELYGEALRIAEGHELDDQLAPAAINSGSIRHHLGEWGAALDLYERGMVGARALGQASALATLAFNLAKLYADIGAGSRARHWVQEATRRANEIDSRALEAAAQTVRAELLRSSQPQQALELYASARETFEALGAERELLEVDVGAAEVVAQDDSEHAAQLLGELELGEYEDIGLRRDLLLAVLKSDVAALRAMMERAKGRLDVRAEASTALAHLDASHTDAARLAWSQIARDLPESLREVFWRHPKRERLKAMNAQTTHGAPPHHKLQRLLAINGKLSSSLETAEVLHMAMDAAIELTGAERGFLVLVDEQGALKVRVARNIDRERIGRSHTKLSWSLAEQVVETGEPVLTLDARDDVRFRDNVSVHAMKLRSVLAVPIPSPDGVRGALYLDNRFRRGRFAEEDADLLMAFADQLAIALRNAELLETLTRRTAELEAERARVEELSRGQAARIETLMAEVRSHRATAERRFDYGQLVGRSASMRSVLDTLDRVIDSPLTILVQGESGTGKELVARAVHTHGPRRDGPFVAINCAALPEALLESELFGHVRGAFTGATTDRQGLMVAADGGTLFLDELGEVSLATQAKLLRALETREVRPVGGQVTKRADFRLVCATNRDLMAEVEAGRFREDLFYRIGVVRVELPALRERVDDIPALCTQLLRRIGKDMERETPVLSAEALEVLLVFAWPGNVRQLANVLATAAVLADGGPIEPKHLQLPAAPSRAEAADQHERDRLIGALRDTDWNVDRASSRLGISRATFYRRMRLHGIKPKRRVAT